MVDLKTLCAEGGRVRTASVSSIGVITSENSASSIRYIDSFQPADSKILEESGNEFPLERSSSNDSLENFADLLGEDDVEDVVPRTSLKSQGSNISSEFYSLQADQISGGGGDSRGIMDDALSMTSQSSGSSTRLNVTNFSPHLSHTRSSKNRSHYSSNDSGALVDAEVSNTTTPQDNAPVSVGPSTGGMLGENLNSNSTDPDKRLSGLAGEIFALLNMK